MSTKTATTETMEIPKDKEDMDAWLRKRFMGCTKAKRKLTRTLRHKLAMEHTEEDAEKITKEFGFKETPLEEL